METTYEQVTKALFEETGIILSVPYLKKDSLLLLLEISIQTLEEKIKFSQNVLTACQSKNVSESFSERMNKEKEEEIKECRKNIEIAREIIKAIENN